MGFTLYSARPASVFLCAQCHDRMGELMQRVVFGPGPAGISLCMPGGDDAALLQPVKNSPLKISVWKTWYVMAFPRHTL